MNKKLILTLIAGLLMVVFTACGGGGDMGDDMDEGARGYREGRLTGYYNDLYQPNPNQTFEISSDKTTVDSQSFPHTKAIQIQDAKFLTDVDPDQLHPDDLYDIVRDELNIELPNAPEFERGTPDVDGPQQPQNPPVSDPEQEQARQPEAPQEQPAPEQPQEEAEQDTSDVDMDGDLKDFERQVIELTNAERQNNGLSTLETNIDLCMVAREKSRDMNENNYFSHTSPTYGSPFDMMRDFGIEYNAAGENIAQGQPTPEQVVQQWMASPGHRENILSNNYNQIGVGYVSQGNHWTQMFINN
ncbi:CAP domain-containing protein [Alteribacter aurantiacus]|uniref:CAP domain-containing protein n=1 Tax=Alteribacter aurantiacus TaxID=254410 RepID=UPI000412C079|nr:CAP domain-containing protein [Alteribacter aurantiacus]